MEKKTIQPFLIYSHFGHMTESIFLLLVGINDILIVGLGFFRTKGMQHSPDELTIELLWLPIREIRGNYFSRNIIVIDQADGREFFKMGQLLLNNFALLQGFLLVGQYLLKIMQKAYFLGRQKQVN